ncbi:hypothetical protein NQ176_g10515 [Zarea fungicola]|uniref:Uncharacterized protein n=1 Tax=Zarea fungicola TaxID=93591 RepID=A0ACC1MG73_9HYPO|nr:hypothetical protein NQ176_g10515 [Lecanicillium fungicola]
MTSPTIPTYEIGVSTTGPAYYLNPKNPVAIASALVILQNLQSQGSLTLQSSNPSEPLKFKTNFLSHPFDRRLAIESMRDALRLIHSEAFEKDGVQAIQEPASTSDEDILQFWRANATTTWHMSGTCSMDRDGAQGGVVDRDFRVYGVQGLRVADCSIFPFVPSAHLQAHAYQVGLIAAEKMIAEYKLG